MTIITCSTRRADRSRIMRACQCVCRLAPTASAACLARTGTSTAASGSWSAAPRCGPCGRSRASPPPTTRHIQYPSYARQRCSAAQGTAVAARLHTGGTDICSGGDTLNLKIGKEGRRPTKAKYTLNARLATTLVLHGKPGKGSACGGGCGAEPGAESWHSSTFSARALHVLCFMCTVRSRPREAAVAVTCVETVTMHILHATHQHPQKRGLRSSTCATFRQPLP